MGSKTLSGRERAKVAIRHGVYPGVGWAEVRCYWCGGAGKIGWAGFSERGTGWVSGWGIEFDHFIPLSLGGENTADNTVLACSWCNRSRCNRSEPSSLPGRRR